MVNDLLETKFQPPILRSSAVDRHRLIDRLERDGMPRLVLVSAPPGFGKSTLIAQWIASRGAGADTAWLSLETADSDPVAFWTYVAAAIERAVPGAGAEARVHLDGPQPRIDRAVAALANALAGVPNELVLVLDDLHVIEAAEVVDGLAFLVDHLPTQVCLVVLTRADPALPLARLRARGELVEVRAADLRFTGEEAAAYLNEGMGLDLRDEDVATLEARTEGWIAALQLAAISMRGRTEVASFIASFAGDDRFVVDYLADEVLGRQPEAVRRFLLRTAILDRLTGPLCDALTGESGGAAALEALDRANLFLVPLDDRRRWYRYHHLFADLLRARLAALPGVEVPELHRRASAWWEANGDPAEAIGHALEAGDEDRASGLIELEARRMLRGRQEATLRRWLDRLPERVYDTWPVLADAHAGTFLVMGRVDGVDHRLRQAERWLDAMPIGGGATSDGGDGADGEPAVGETAISEGTVGADPLVGPRATDLESLRSLRGAVALHRAGLAWMQGDLPSTIAHARRALDVARDQPAEAGGAAAILGLAAWSTGDLAAAHGAWSEGAAALASAEHFADVLGCSIAIADIEVSLGRLGDARRTCERCLRLSDAHGDPTLRGAADMHVFLADLHREWNELAEARRHLSIAGGLGEGLGLPQFPYRWRVVQAAVLRAEGDIAGALALLDEAERVYDGDFFPEVHPVASARARLWVASGRHQEALDWARARRLSVHDEPAFLLEDPHLTLCRAMVAQSAAEANGAIAKAAADFLGRLLDAAERGGRVRSMIEVRAVRAIAHATAGEERRAAQDLELAIELAEPERFARLILDEGPAMTALLAMAVRRDRRSPAARLLPGEREPSGPPINGKPLPERLSDRELDVLRLLATDLDGPAIAAQLFVSLNTMRTHTKSIFAKLGVNSRRAAVRRAEEAGILGRGR